VFTFDDIKLSVNEETYSKACDIYESGKILSFKEDTHGFNAVVQGTERYNVEVSKAYYDSGTCDCYLGERDILCKHMVAVAIYAIYRGKDIPIEQKEIIVRPRCSKRKGELDKEQLALVKKQITNAKRYIKDYRGPSRKWFTYQDSLTEGVRRLSMIISELPVSLQTAELLVSLLLKLDKRLSSGGVDDSDGTVGEFILETVSVLIEFSKIDPQVVKSFKKVIGVRTCFDWEGDLVVLYRLGT